MISLTVAQKRSGPIKGRHPWVFSGALLKIPEGLKSGDTVKLVDETGTFLAHGYFNSYSQIAVRLWSWNEDETIDQSFFEKRIQAALEIRERFVASKETDGYRVVYGENDLLPGLVVDRYADYVVVQFHNAGIAAWKKEVTAALVSVLEPKGIYERSDMKTRDREAGETEEKNNLLYGKVPDQIKIKENGFTFAVDVKTGQKTGFFLDQRDKRAALQKYVKGKHVLNCFSYTGGFSVYAAAAGAKSVTSVDGSESALKLAEENFKVNKLDEKKAEFILADVKQYLLEQKKGSFDVIILDPPAFVKDRHKVREGLQGYRKINEMALRILPENGILVTASCSAHVSMQDFRFMLSEAASRAGRTVQIIETYTHGIDHPELVAFTEGEYLKCLFVIVH